MSTTTKYEYEPHCFCMKLGAKFYCHKCGLIPAKNALTQLAMKLGCDHTQHPSWKNRVHQYTGHNGPQ